MNLIFTCPRNFEGETIKEITEMLTKFGDDKPVIKKTSLNGILKCSTNLKSIEVIKKIKELIEDEPWNARYFLRVIPIQKEILTDVLQIKNAVLSMKNQIKDNQSYRITVEKRNSKISTKEIISSIASEIPNKVSLEEPDCVIQIEILGGKTGISIIRPADILSVVRIKRSLN